MPSGDHLNTNDIFKVAARAIKKSPQYDINDSKQLKEYLHFSFATPSS